MSRNRVRGAEGVAGADDGGNLGELRGRLLREAARVSGATNRTLGDVIQEAAKARSRWRRWERLGTRTLVRLKRRCGDWLKWLLHDESATGRA